eukprot:TRINITY_DN16595_c0_g1_i4.p1 TRINITY_DN16595_c0_g1~~TRINITY_DN16595_c0_g1_i4.p1  ORF type:complete len:538 (+),score=112.18 TRINITY_DN16595_c0_g1_i4:45-1658(+)
MTGGAAVQWPPPMPPSRDESPLLDVRRVASAGGELFGRGFKSYRPVALEKPARSGGPGDVSTLSPAVAGAPASGRRRRTLNDAACRSGLMPLQEAARDGGLQRVGAPPRIGGSPGVSGCVGGTDAVSPVVSLDSLRTAMQRSSSLGHWGRRPQAKNKRLAPLDNSSSTPTLLRAVEAQRGCVSASPRMCLEASSREPMLASESGGGCSSGAPSEISVMINQLLQRNPETRRRNLEVRTFHVVIFAESCGLIEWVSNTKGMRIIIDELWRSMRSGQQQTAREIKDMFDRSHNLYETFVKQVLPRHPPILHHWFSLRADPSTWLSRRLSFSRSQALWCMLGYVVGLGDRHGENILLDTESGMMVHVDFDCIFGKGMLLERPETVPFRLTQNCVSAMGVTGVEGAFRQSCELAMGIMRDNANQQTLLSVLHAFIADPLIEWASRSRQQDLEEHRIQQARSTIGDVEKKLNGMLNVGAVVGGLKAHLEPQSVLSMEERGRSLLGRDRGVGLSVAGQVDELLKAAMCKRNLSEMYVGWQPWQ